MDNIGSPRKLLNFGHGVRAFKRDGQWRYRNTQTSKFIAATDAELLMELERRGFKVLHPPHECVDRPNLPCPACDAAKLGLDSLVDSVVRGWPA